MGIRIVENSRYQLAVQRNNRERLGEMYACAEAVNEAWMMYEGWFRRSPVSMRSCLSDPALDVDFEAPREEECRILEGSPSRADSLQENQHVYRGEGQL